MLGFSTFLEKSVPTFIQVNLMQVSILSSGMHQIILKESILVSFIHPVPADQNRLSLFIRTSAPFRSPSQFPRLREVRHSLIPHYMESAHRVRSEEHTSELQSH